MPQLWAWEAIYPDGSKGTFQTREAASIASEGEMLAHLKGAYPNVTIIGMRRIENRQYIEPKGPVKRHAFQCGAWDAVARELGLMPEDRKQSMMERWNKERLLGIAGFKNNRPLSIRERMRSALA